MPQWSTEEPLENCNVKSFFAKSEVRKLRVFIKKKTQSIFSNFALQSREEWKFSCAKKKKT